MISTGNDIVALKAINVARTTQENFYKKILSGSEIIRYHEHISERISLATFVWLLWSVKESAYKYLQRISPGLIFSPTKIVIDHIELPASQGTFETEGKGFDGMAACKCVVTHDGQTLHACSLLSQELIFSVVSPDDSFRNIYWGIQRIASADPQAQSAAVRTLVTSRLHAVFPGSDLRIGKSPEGYPIVIKGDAEIPLPVSLAHHDRYVGYSFWTKK